LTQFKRKNNFSKKKCFSTREEKKPIFEKPPQSAPPKKSSKELWDAVLNKDKQNWLGKTKSGTPQLITNYHTRKLSLMPDSSAFVCQGLVLSKNYEHEILRRQYRANDVLFGVYRETGAILYFPVLVFKTKPFGDLLILIQGIQFFEKQVFTLISLPNEPDDLDFFKFEHIVEFWVQSNGNPYDLFSEKMSQIKLKILN